MIRIMLLSSTLWVCLFVKCQMEQCAYLEGITS